MQTQETKSYHRIAVDALSMSAQERAELAGALLASLEERPPLSDEEQRRVVQERVRRYEAGEDATIPFEEAMTELRQKHGL